MDEERDGVVQVDHELGEFCLQEPSKQITDEVQMHYQCPDGALARQWWSGVEGIRELVVDYNPIKDLPSQVTLHDHSKQWDMRRYHLCAQLLSIPQEQVELQGDVMLMKKSGPHKGPDCVPLALLDTTTSKSSARSGSPGHNEEILMIMYRHKWMLGANFPRKWCGL